MELQDWTLLHDLFALVLVSVQDVRVGTVVVVDGLGVHLVE